MTPGIASSLITRVFICFLTALVPLQRSEAKDANDHKAKAIYAPLPIIPEIAKREFWSGSGRFVFNVRPDGTVSRVDILQSTGHNELDAAVVAAFSRWRFSPGTVSKVHIPVTFSGNYTRWK
ncbi:MAG: energy transducer TonB [Chthoniobacterales bacterium]